MKLVSYFYFSTHANRPQFTCQVSKYDIKKKKVNGTRVQLIKGSYSENNEKKKRKFNMIISSVLYQFLVKYTAIQDKVVNLLYGLHKLSEEQKHVADCKFRVRFGVFHLTLIKSYIIA